MNPRIILVFFVLFSQILYAKEATPLTPTELFHTKWEVSHSTVANQRITIFFNQRKTESEHEACAVTVSEDENGKRGDTIVLAVFDLRGSYYVRQVGMLKIINQLKLDSGEFAIEINLQMFEAESALGGPSTNVRDNSLFREKCGPKLPFLPSPLGDILKQAFQIGKTI